MKIAEVSEQYGISTDTLRYYERVGLIPPVNRSGIGNVRIDPLNQAPAPARVSIAGVTFEPGARTACHSHPLGQTLIVTAGSGLVQSWGKQAQHIHAGDVVWSEPGEKHWHGAAPTTAMAHISIVEQLDGKAADWMEHVSDGQYQAE